MNSGPQEIQLFEKKFILYCFKIILISKSGFVINDTQKYILEEQCF